MEIFSLISATLNLPPLRYIQFPSVEPLSTTPSWLLASHSTTCKFNYYLHFF